MDKGHYCIGSKVLCACSHMCMCVCVRKYMHLHAYPLIQKKGESYASSSLWGVVARMRAGQILMHK